ncbi:hypothetical protein EJ110_NYTH17392 [Nymphaea thermarum]|nr:hypothetical protein EJ110_NYTH17392 [Nymphaea thermarum]
MEEAAVDCRGANNPKFGTIGNMEEGVDGHREAGDEGLFSDSTSSSDDSTGSDLEEEESDFIEDETCSSSSSFSPPISASASSNQLAEGGGSLFEMSSIMAELPFKRGLSRHYDGKSQSFTSLADVKCLADLAKPENPYNKRLKSSRSYGGNLLDCQFRSYPPRGITSISKTISKRSTSTAARTGSSCSSSMVRRNSFAGTKPPIPSHRHP